VAFNVLMTMSSALTPWGPFTNDVSREGEGGGWPISDERKGGCVDLVLTRGREGVQNPQNLADVICERPLSFIPPNKYYSDSNTVKDRTNTQQKKNLSDHNVKFEERVL